MGGGGRLDADKHIGSRACKQRIPWERMAIGGWGDGANGGQHEQRAGRAACYRYPPDWPFVDLEEAL